MLNQFSKSKMLIAATVLSSALLSACSDDTTIGSKSFSENESFVIPRSPIQFTGTFPIPIDVAIDPTADDPDLLNNVTSVSVKGISFNISPDSNNPAIDTWEDNNPDTFEFVSELTLSLVANVNGEQQVVQVATLPANDPQIASNLETLQMVVENTDIRDLLEAPGGCKLRVQIAGTTPVDEIHIDVNIDFRVGLGIRR